MTFAARLFVPALAALALAACGGEAPKTAFTPVPVTPVIGDVPIGSENAPVTMIEYAALTCPHCRDFWKWELPKLKAQYLDTGKVKLIYRDFPIDGEGLGVLLASVARCAGKDKYVAMVDDMFTRQYDVLTAATSGGAKPILTEIGATHGLTWDQIQTCIDHQPDLRASIEKSQAEGSAKGVKSTPAVFINDELVTNPTWENVVAKIEEKLGNAPPATAPAAATTPAPPTPTPAPAPAATPPASPPS